MVVEEISKRKRSRSFSIGSCKKDDLQTKYWSLLFENLRRSVDEIYSVCESGECVVECKEIMALLETYTNDFKSLIKHLQSKKDFDSSHILKRHNRPAWDFKKSAPPVKPAKKSQSPSATSNVVEENVINEGSVVIDPVKPLVATKEDIPEKKIDDKYALSVISSDNSSASLETTVTKVKVTAAPMVLAKPPEKTPKYSQAVNRSVSGSQTAVSLKKVVTKRIDTGLPNRGAKTSVHVKPAVSSRLALRNSAEKQKPVSSSRPATMKPVSTLKEQQRRFGVSVEDLPSNATGVYEEGSHGWEMVRGRPRLKNSPPKLLSKDRSASQSVINLAAPKQTKSLLQRAKTVIAPLISSKAVKASEKSPKLERTPSKKKYEKAPSFRTETTPRKRPSPALEGSKTLPRQKKPLIKVSPRISRREISKQIPVSSKEVDKNDSLVVTPAETVVVTKEEDKLNNGAYIEEADEARIGAKEDDKRDHDVKFTSENVVLKSDLASKTVASDSINKAKINVESANLSNKTCIFTITNSEAFNFSKPIGDMLLSELLAIGDSPDVYPNDALIKDGKAEADEKKAMEDICVSGTLTPRDDESLLDEKEMLEHDAAWEKALREEACLRQQMMETEGTDTDTDTDELFNSDVGSCGERTATPPPQPFIEGMSWSDEVEFSERVGGLLARAPLEVHEKLSSPSRRRVESPDKAFKQIEERQARASRLRKQLFEERVSKRKELQKKIDEVRDAKDKLAEQKRNLLERKMKRADEKRQHHLADIVRKAHDEEQKLRELAFINELEAQNKRIDFITSCQNDEERLHVLQEERQRKNEEKAAKDAAVEERKKALEAERKAKLVEIQERRRKKEEKIDRENQEKAKYKEELIREKQRDRQERLSALQAAQQATVEELQKKIQLKQEEYARRHEENIENIKHRASELSVPRFPSTPEEAPYSTPFEKKRYCSLCKVLIISELQLNSHIRGRNHHEAFKNSTDFCGEDIDYASCITEAPKEIEDQAEKASKEQKKVYAKRLKRIKNRMLQRSGIRSDRSSLSENLKKSRLNKLICSIDKAISRQTPGQWDLCATIQVERSADEITKIFTKEGESAQLAFHSLDGFDVLSRAFFTSLPDNSHAISRVRFLEIILICLRLSVSGCFAVAAHELTFRPPLNFVDFLIKRLESLLVDHNQTYAAQLCVITTLPSDSLSCGILSLISGLLSTVSLHSPCSAEVKSTEVKESVDANLLKQQLVDFISYLLCSGLINYVYKELKRSSQITMFTN
ncbi:S phase cyclin A-associated protein in the endoplasmic reticulum-like isoform X2 [Artemia franciscana]|uniref:S phase cyclin A-associated protein in the endoplasmic reticulum-like isoform X2 n=1 Tax=Artemia franciscana TaxID=6661 RepID=UPI0032D9CC9E